MNLKEKHESLCHFLGKLKSKFDELDGEFEFKGMESAQKKWDEIVLFVEDYIDKYKLK